MLRMQQVYEDVEMAAGEVMAVSKVYADVNARLGREWYEYNSSTQIQWGSQDRYEILAKLGHGKYSEVFLGMDVVAEERCVIKVLKPVKRVKIRREIKVLQNLAGGPNIVRLLDVVRDEESKIPSLITEYVQAVDSKYLFPKFTDWDVRFYVFEILAGLEFCHSKGIIHRDIKPQNIMIDHERRKLRIIDWGLAEFYHPGERMNCRVATRVFKSPELLVNYGYYDYSLDLWSLGATFAAMIFRKTPFFHGHDNADQLVKIAKVLGTDGLYAFVAKYNIAFDEAMGACARTPWARFVTADNGRYMSGEAIDLLDRLLRYDFAERLTAAEARAHRYFDPVRARRDEYVDTEDSGLSSA